jgi:hypothetical protein
VLSKDSSAPHSFLGQVDLQALQAPNQQINRIRHKKLCGAELFFA